MALLLAAGAVACSTDSTPKDTTGGEDTAEELDTAVVEDTGAADTAYYTRRTAAAAPAHFFFATARAAVFCRISLRTTAATSKCNN